MMNARLQVVDLGLYASIIGKKNTLSWIYQLELRAFKIVLCYCNLETIDSQRIAQYHYN